MRKSPLGSSSYIPSQTVRTTCTRRSPTAAGGSGRSICSPVSARQRSAKWSWTSRTTGPRSRLGGSLADDRAVVVAAQIEVRRQVPAAHLDRLAGAGDRVGDRRERLRAVDQHVELAAMPRWGLSRRPPAIAGWIQGGLNQTSQTP